jgi:hypothetical protein
MEKTRHLCIKGDFSNYSRMESLVPPYLQRKFAILISCDRITLQSSIKEPIGRASPKTAKAGEAKKNWLHPASASSSFLTWAYKTLHCLDLRETEPGINPTKQALKKCES